MFKPLFCRSQNIVTKTPSTQNAWNMCQVEGRHLLTGQNHFESRRVSISYWLEFSLLSICHYPTPSSPTTPLSTFDLTPISLLLQSLREHNRSASSQLTRWVSWIPPQLWPMHSKPSPPHCNPWTLIKREPTRGFASHAQSAYFCSNLSHPLDGTRAMRTVRPGIRQTGHPAIESSDLGGV